MGKKKGKQQTELSSEDKANLMAELLADEEKGKSKAPKPAPKKKKGKPSHADYMAMLMEGEENSGSEGEKSQPIGKATSDSESDEKPKKAAPKKKPEPESESESESEEEEKPKPKAKKAAPKKGKGKNKMSDAEYLAMMAGGDDEEISGEDEQPEPSPKKGKKVASESEEEEKPKPKAKKAAPKKGKGKNKMSDAEYLAMMAGGDEEESDDDAKKAKEEAERRKKQEEEEQRKKQEEEQKRKQEEEEAEKEEATEEEEEESSPSSSPKKAKGKEKKGKDKAKGKKKKKKAESDSEGSDDEKSDKVSGDEEEKSGKGSADEADTKLTRKERKELEKKKAYERELASAMKQSKKPVFTGDSPYSVRFPDEAWKVEDKGRDIRVDGLSIAVPGKELFRDTSVKILSGHRYGLIGPNGRGKSSVLRLIADRELPVPKLLHVLLVEQEQEVDEEFLEMTVVDVVVKSHKKRFELLEEAEKLRESGEDLERLQEVEEELDAMGAYQAEAKARKILFGLGFPHEWQDRKTSSFSGGWRKRVALACAVFMEPDVLLLDEPTNHLDLNAVIWLENYLPSVYNESKKKPKSLVVVSHDVSFLDEVCTDTVHIEECRLNYYRGGYNNFLVQLAQHKQQVNNLYEKLKKQIDLMKKKGATNDQIKEFIADQEKKGKEVHTSKLREYKVTFPFDQPPSLRDASILKCEQMHFRYGDEHPWIFGGPENPQGVDFSVWTDSRIALVGPNGCGKTTLINILAGNLSPTKGYNEINRQVRIGRYSQHFVEQLPLDKTPVEFLCTKGVQTEFKARSKLGAFGLDSTAHLQKISTLSGGQKVRVAFAGLSAGLPHLLLLDEPTNHLDMESIEALASALNNYEGGVLVITHDARLITTVNAELWVVENKNVVKFDGDLEDYKEHLVQLLGLEEERKERELEKKREEKRARNMEDALDAMEHEREIQKTMKKKIQAAEDEKKQKEKLLAQQNEALEEFFGKKEKKEKKDKKDKKEEKKDKEEKKEKKEKKDKKDKDEKKEKKEKKDKK